MTRHLVESEAGRRWLPEVGEGGYVDAESTARLIAVLASGAADELNGRFLHALDDVEELLAGSTRSGATTSTCRVCGVFRAPDSPATSGRGR